VAVPDANPTSGRAQLHHLLRFGEPPPRPGAGRFRRFVKRAFMRVLRPYASYQQRINRSATAAIDELGTTVAQLAEQTSQTNEEAVRDLSDQISSLRLQLAEATSETREAITARAAELEDLRGSIGETEEAVDDALASQRALTKRGAESEASLRLAEKGVGDLRAALEETESRLAAAIELHEQAGKEGQEQLAKGVASLEAESASTRSTLAAVREELSAAQGGLDKLASDVDGTLNRDRHRVDALEQSQQGFVAEINAKIGELREHADQAAALVRASAAKPYMASDSFSARRHPLLGETAGFDGKSAGGYRGFEDIFRGSEGLIRDRQGVYIDLVTGFGPVLDAGCGRGEFLDLLREHGIERMGVDSNPEMVERCQEKGHGEVKKTDLVKYLGERPQDSLGAVFSAQVIEHLELEELQRFLDLSLDVLRPGGLLIAETVNPHSAQALKAFWVDPTHRQPLFPETMLALCQLAGFASADVFCPLGEGNWEMDRITQGEYAIVAIAPEREG
jgi:SAM-dependent methyltransferase/predicted  nucleic acid-binding Zn-ribbon protein